MHIIINNREAVLKKGVSFDYIAENRFFTGADSYTLSITFPLKGCQQNIDIFGHINRKDSNLDKLLMDCEIYDRGFQVSGAVNIVEISEEEVKTQFLQGKSATNYSSALDTIYINEVQVGYAQDWAYLPASWFMGAPGQDYYKGYVSLPWVNNTSGNMQNAMTFYDSHWTYRDVDLQNGALLSCQYYLIYALKIILDSCGFRYDLSVLENSDYKYLLIFNTFPHAWDMEEWSNSLPHWTVSEFLEQIELFTNGVFDIDTRRKKVTFSFNWSVLNNQKSVVLKNIVDEFSVEITDSSKSENTYIEQSNLKYSEADHQMQNLYACDWAVGKMRRLSYMSYDDMLTDVHNYKEWSDNYGNLPVFNRLLYVQELQTYFTLKCYKIVTDSKTGRVTKYLRIVPVNVYGSRGNSGSEEGRSTELGIVPVCIDHCDDTVGDCVFLNCGTYGDAEEEDEAKKNQCFAYNTVNNAEKEKGQEYFDKIYVGFWDGDCNAQNLSKKNLYPLPWIDKLCVDYFGNYNLTDKNFSMRLKGTLVNDNWKVKNKIDQTKKFTFSFLVENGVIPDVKSIFYIHGKKYLAEKITATFTENGMSQLVKMVAYRII
jgi:hypothetical protein